MRRVFLAVTAIGLALGGGSTPVSTQAQQPLGFFITSAGKGDGANLGGLAGADAHCQALAKAAGAGTRQWRAYLSASAAGGQAAVNAKDRIGTGPWYNAKGVLIANNVADLHNEAVTKVGKDNSLTEKGTVVNGRGDTPNQHDILTGSNMDGTLASGAGDVTCGNWSSNKGDGSALVGHHDRQGGGANPNSWNSAHPSKGCGQQNLIATGGNGYFYCFAAK
jgi:hypothetical protein